MGVRFLIFLILLLAQSAVAQVTSISGASQTVGTNPITEAWGVFVGEHDATKTVPYDNCGSLSGTDFDGCHKERASGNATITVNFTFSSTSGTGTKYPHAVFPPNSTDTGTSNRLLKRGTTSISTETGTASISFTWKELCNAVTGLSFDDINQVCSGNAEVKVAFGVGVNESDISTSNLVTFTIYMPDPNLGDISDCNDANDYGFCDISLYPGDSGFHVKPIEGSTKTNQLKTESFIVSAIDAFGAAVDINLNVTALRLFASENYLFSAPYSPAELGDFEIESVAGGVATFKETEFGGLKNDTNYFIRAATLDSSGTIAQLFNDSAYCPGCPLTGTCPKNTCPSYEITPSVVAGIIEENSCFITTATYGSDQAYQVHLFRKFRKKFLFANKFGHKIIRTYNSYGPVGASWIRQHPASQKYVRQVLKPFYWFAYLSVHYGITAAIALYSGLVLAIFGLIKLKPLRFMGVK